MRITIDVQDIQDHLNRLNKLQIKLKNTKFTDLTTPKLVRLVSDLGETTGQIQAFTTMLKQASSDQTKG